MIVLWILCLINDYAQASMLLQVLKLIQILIHLCIRLLVGLHFTRRHWLACVRSRTSVKVLYFQQVFASLDMLKTNCVRVDALPIFEVVRLRPHPAPLAIDEFLSVALCCQILDSNIRNGKGTTIVHRKHAGRGRAEWMLLVILTIIDVGQVSPI